MHGEHDRRVRRLDRVPDRRDVVRQPDPGAVSVDGFEAGKGDRADVVTSGTKQLGDLVPGPRPEPEPGYQDDRR